MVDAFEKDLAILASLTSTQESAANGVARIDGEGIFSTSSMRWTIAMKMDLYADIGLQSDTPGHLPHWSARYQGPIS